MKRKYEQSNNSEDSSDSDSIQKKACVINKIVLLGDGCTGKSTFFHKLNTMDKPDYKFPKNYKATETFDFNRINLDTNFGKLTIDLWDTAGQETKGSLRDAYLKGADAVLLLYDVTKPKSIENITKWLEQVKRVCPNVPVAVVGNKSDTFANVQQSEVVKLRECNLQRDVGHKNIKNFLVSIKENTHIESTTSFFFGTDIKEEPGCFVGLEYLLKNMYGKDIKIDY